MAKEKRGAKAAIGADKPHKRIIVERTVIATLIFAIFLVAGFLAAYFGCDRIARERSRAQFEDAANTVIDQINSKFEQDSEVLRAAAQIVAASDVYDADGAIDQIKLTAALQTLKPLQRSMRFRILLPDDTILLPNDETSAAFAFRFETEKEHGEHISHRFSSSLPGAEGTQLIAHFVPILKDGETVALLYGVTTLSSLPSLLRADNLYNSNASVLIFDVVHPTSVTDENGRTVEKHAVIMDTRHPDRALGYLEDYTTGGQTRGSTLSTISKELLGLKNGYTQIKSKTTNRWEAFYYAPARATDPENPGVVADQWEVCITVPASVAFGNVSEVRLVFIIVGIVLTLALVAYFVFVRFAAKDAIEKSVERAVLEEKLRKAEAAERAKTTFLSNMSHDIRTPMNAILGFAALAETNIDNRDRVQDYLKKILSSGNHLLSLINDILDMSRIESGKLNIEEKPCNISDIFRDMRNIIQTQMKSKQLNFFMDTLDVTDEDIFCDKLHLNQVLLNLLSNSIKFTPAGGSVSLTIRQLPDAPTGYGSYEIRVKDTGIGMSKEFARHIFEPFERERTSTVSGIQGTGLGMAITKNIVDTMGGTIELETEQGKGTEFVLRLQFRLQTERRHYGTIRELEGLRALVVDDSFTTCDSVSKMLATIGMRSEWTLYGKEAVLRTRQAIDIGEPFAAYIIDWVMPDLSGFEIVRQIRKLVGDDVPIIIVTAYDVTAIMDEAKDIGVTAYCNKPIFLSDLRDTLVSCVGREPEQTEEPPAVASPLAGKRLLLVEDNALNREIAQEVLLENGFVVECAEDGSIAVDMVNAEPIGYYDLILMDIQMPILDGYGATRAIRAIEGDKHNVPIVAMTANAFDEDRQKALECGMNAHVAKPINIGQLLSVIEKLLLPDEGKGAENGE